MYWRMGFVCKESVVVRRCYLHPFARANRQRAYPRNVSTQISLNLFMVAKLPYQLKHCFLSNTDVDECENDVCDSDALCTNTEGSYVCGCGVGYMGDGKTCAGMISLSC